MGDPLQEKDLKLKFGSEYYLDEKSQQIMKEEVVHICSGILSSYDKEWNLAICKNMDEPRWYYAKLNKWDTEDKYHMILLICGI